jgi:anthranilate synthase component 1
MMSRPGESTVVRRIETFRPDLLRLHAAAPARHPVLLESASTGGPRGRWDLLAVASGEVLTLHADGALTGRSGGAKRFLDALDAWFAADSFEPPMHAASGATPELPFLGGWFLYLGYELAGEVEPRLRLPRGPAVVAHAVRAPAAVLYDHAAHETWLVAEPSHGIDLAALERSVRATPWGIDADAGAGRAGEANPTSAASTGRAPSLLLREDPPERYLSAVRAALEYVAAGDVYQANLARAWRGPLPVGVQPAELYARLRAANPGPFAALAQLPHGTVLSTSPERLVESRGGVVSTRPIAGTRPRLGDDAATVEELRADVKERAEHVMLVDLERNDLGRICAAGSVVVDESMTVESYAHVHHIVSNVRGRLRADVTPGGVIRALFPGGTITGCPKVRCMEIIGELEDGPRGAYTGSIGYLSRCGAMDLNILIRTATIVDGTVEVRAGAGIVADSDPKREIDETRAKARGLLRGLGGEAAG